VHVTRLVARILDVPIALLSLPRADEYRFRVNIGLDGYESVPCRISFCAYTMLGTDLLVVADARIDVSKGTCGSLALRTSFYVGVPLISRVVHACTVAIVTSPGILRDTARPVARCGANCVLVARERSGAAR
jgi:hypothetical protein